MRLKDFDIADLNKFRQLCNFTKDERDYFELKLKGYSNIRIAIEMYISESQVSKLARKVKSKINRIYGHF